MGKEHALGYFVDEKNRQIAFGLHQTNLSKKEQSVHERNWENSPLICFDCINKIPYGSKSSSHWDELIEALAKQKQEKP